MIYLFDACQYIYVFDDECVLINRFPEATQTRLHVCQIQHESRNEQS